jgi:hypothetical protein
MRVLGFHPTNLSAISSLAVSPVLSIASFSHDQQTEYINVAWAAETNTPINVGCMPTALAHPRREHKYQVNSCMQLGFSESLGIHRIWRVLYLYYPFWSWVAVCGVINIRPSYVNMAACSWSCRAGLDVKWVYSHSHPPYNLGRYATKTPFMTM